MQLKCVPGFTQSFMMTGSLDLNETRKDKHYGKAVDSHLTEEEWQAEKEKQLEEMEEEKNG